MPLGEAGGARPRSQRLELLALDLSPQPVGDLLHEVAGRLRFRRRPLAGQGPGACAIRERLRDASAMAVGVGSPGEVVARCPPRRAGGTRELLFRVEDQRVPRGPRFAAEIPLGDVERPVDGPRVRPCPP